jgi:hypothetical protein
MFEQVFKNMDDVLRKAAGCTTGLDSAAQTCWSTQAALHKQQGKKLEYLHQFGSHG